MVDRSRIPPLSFVQQHHEFALTARPALKVRPVHGRLFITSQSPEPWWAWFDAGKLECTQ